MPDNVLKIVAEFDVSQVVEAAKQCSAALDQIGSGIARNTAALAEGSTSIKDVQSGLVNLGYSATQAADAAAILTGQIKKITPTTEEVNSAIAQLEAEIAGLNDQVATLEERLARSRTATVGLKGAMGEARVEAGALTGSTGMMVGGLARLAAQSQLVAPLIAAMFPLFGAIAFIDILEGVAKAIGKASDELMGYTEEVKKAEKQDVEFSEKAEEAAHSLGDAIRNLATANQELASVENESFSEKFTNAAKDHTSSILAMLGPVGDLVNTYNQLAGAESDAADQATHLSQVQRAQIININEQIAEQDKRSLTLIEAKSSAEQAAMTSAIERTKEKLSVLDQEEEKQRNLARQEEAVRSMKSGGRPDFSGVDAQIVSVYAEKRKELQNELSKQEIDLSNKTRDVEIENARAIAVAQETARKQNIDQLKAEYLITTEQEASLLRTVEDDTYKAEKEAIDKRIALLKTEGVEHASEIKRLEGEEIALQITHDAKIREIDDKSRNEQVKASNELAETQISNDLRIQEATIRLAMTREEYAFKKSDTAEDVERTAAPLIEQTTALYQAQIDALEKRRAVLESTMTVDTTEKTKQLSDITAQENEARITGEEAVLRIEEDKRTKLEEINRQVAEDQISTINEQVDVVKQGTERQEEINKTSYEMRDEKLREYEAKEVTILQNEYDSIAAVLAREADLWRHLAETQVITQQEASKKIEAIWREMEHAHLEMETKIQKTEDEARRKQDESIDKTSKKWSTDWSQMVNSVLRGQQTIGQALIHMAAEMELQLIDKGIEFVAQKTAQWLLTLLASHVSFLAELAGVEVASNATKMAQDKVAQEAEVADKAGIAGASGFASVMAALPFPENVATAPGVAAAAAASTIAIGQFELGGVVPGQMGAPVPAMVHGGERVLTAAQNATFEKSIHNVTGGSRTMHNHVRIEVHQHGGKSSQDDIVAAVRKGIRAGALSAQHL